MVRISIYLLIVLGLFLSACKKDNDNNKAEKGFILQYDLGASLEGSDMEILDDGTIVVLYSNTVSNEERSGLLYLSPDGALLKTVDLDKQDDVTAYNLMVKGDDGFFLTGRARSTRQYLMKTDLNGNEIWRKIIPADYRGSNWGNQTPRDIIRVSDGTVVILSELRDFSGNILALINRYDDAGNIVFEAPVLNNDIGGSNLRTPRTIIEQPNRDFLFLSDRWSPGNDTDITLAEVSYNGIINSSGKWISYPNLGVRFTYAQSMVKVDSGYLAFVYNRGIYPFTASVFIGEDWRLKPGFEISRFSEARGPNSLHADASGNIYAALQVRNDATVVNNFAVYAFKPDFKEKWNFILPINTEGMALALKTNGKRLYATGYTLPSKTDGKRKIITIVNLNKESGTFE